MFRVKSTKVLLASVALSFGVFAQLASAATPFPSNSYYDVGFSPDGGALDVVIGGISAAKKSILVAAFAFTSKPIAMALIDAHKRGVDVRVIGDADQNSRSYTAITYLANEGIPVALNSNYKEFHNKYMVIDGIHVETGSFNYSQQATKNAENAILLWNVPDIAARYTEHWKRWWAESKPVSARY